MRMRLVIVAVFAISSVTTSAQSLGEIAKKAAAEKAAKKDDGKTKPPAKTITDKDLKADPTAPATPPLESVPAAKADTTAKDAKTDTAKDKEPVKDEWYWRARMSTLNDKLATDRRAADVVRDNLNAVRSKLEANMPSLTVFGPEVVRLTTEMRTWNATLDADLAAIEALKEEGRRAGALPGWFR